jgi:hypothetical protein
MNKGITYVASGWLPTSGSWEEAVLAWPEQIALAFRRWDTAQKDVSHGRMERSAPQRVGLCGYRPRRLSGGREAIITYPEVGLPVERTMDEGQDYRVGV